MLTLSQTSSCQLTLASADDRFAAELEDRKNGLGDVDIVVNDKSIKTHRAVLTHHSDYFKIMFEGGFAERTTSSVDLSNVFESVDELNIFLDFMYTETMTLSEDNILSVLNAASLFLLSELQAACSEFLIVNVAPSTCISIFIVAERYSLKELQGVCVEVIRSWFPFTLYESQEAIEMPPEGLKILIDENVLGLLSDETREAFLQKWHENFRNSTNGNVPLPTEVEDLLKPNSDTNQSEDGAQKARSETDENEMEEVLITLMVTPPPGSDQCCVEIQAFALKLNTWKLILRHAFSKLVRPKIVPKLIGVSEKKAFFLFMREQLTEKKTETECVIAVDLKSKEETLIKIPYNAQGGSSEGTPHFLLLDDLLCGMFFEQEGYRWALFKNVHEAKCSNHCDGKCWANVCDMPLFKRFDPIMDEVDYTDIESYEFHTKAFKKDLYVWIKSDSVMRCYLSDMRYYRISQSKRSGEKYQMTELPPPWDREEIDFYDFENYDSDASSYSDSELDDENPKWRHSELSSIALDSRSSTMKFVLKLESQNEITDLEGICHKEYVHTFDISKNEWEGKAFCKIVYPEDCPGPLKVDEDDDYFEYGDYPFRNPYTKTDEEDDYYTEIIGHLYTHELVIYEYYMRHTSPYNTSIWKLEPKGEESMIITHLPHALYKFQGYLPSEFRVGFFKTLPKAGFQDFSEEIGHSAVAYVYPPSAEFQLVYNGRLLAHKDYENLWAQLWQESIKTKGRVDKC